jgi:hypothetical protein
MGLSLLANGGQFPEAHLVTDDSLGRVNLMASRRQALTPGAVSVGVGGQGDVCPKERGEVTLVRAPDLETNLNEGHVARG